MEKKEKDELLELILKNYKRLVTYYPYRTGGYGLENVIASTDNHNSEYADQYLKNFVNLMVQLGASAAGYRNDNKTAVEVQVDGLDYPIYFYKYDGKYTITKRIDSEHEGTKINWTVE